MVKIVELKVLDCSDLVCPLPVAKTKKMLNSMQNSEILEVKGDFSEAGENIKRFAESHGHKVVEFKLEGENYSIIIKKK
ncbi:MAG: sulfurtransferase TusA family protein [Candidatus Lokiarchaeota archaeon]|nr:sulfurtransferase TusA family protein [Candidatus Lokiarchaeota archaeon]